MGWNIASVIDHTIDISIYKPLSSNSYIKLPKYLDHPRKGLINSPNMYNNKYLKWCLVEYFSHAHKNPARSRKTDKDAAR